MATITQDQGTNTQSQGKLHNHYTGSGHQHTISRQDWQPLHRVRAPTHNLKVSLATITQGQGTNTQSQGKLDNHYTGSGHQHTISRQAWQPLHRIRASTHNLKESLATITQGQGTNTQSEGELGNHYTRSGHQQTISR